MSALFRSAGKGMLLGLALVCALAVQAAAEDAATIEARLPDLLQKSIDQTALDLIRIRACLAAWNTRMENASSALSKEGLISFYGSTEQDVTRGDVVGHEYRFVAPLLYVQACGSLLVRNSTLQMEDKILGADNVEMDAAAGDITRIINLSDPSGGKTINDPEAFQMFQKDVAAAVSHYNHSFGDIIEATSGKSPRQALDAIVASLPVISPPAETVSASDGPKGAFAALFGDHSDEGWAIRMAIAKDAKAFSEVLMRAYKQ